MAKTITIVMYHYVRNLSRTRYPEIKGLDLPLFREQLAYIRRHYEVIKAQDLISAVKQQEEFGAWDLPDNALLLTFDDGYSDHFQNVFPLLDEARIQGSFFPPAKVIRERKVLDVNKIHFILASVENKQSLVGDIFEVLNRYRDEFQLESNDSYYSKLAKPSRHDPAETVFIKRALQVALPSALRETITTDLFAKYVSSDEAGFAAELYMSTEQLRCLARNGMYIGSHGYHHSWLGHLPPEEQAQEVDRSLGFLAELGVDLEGWIMCYPYGNSNESLLEILKQRRCAVGLTTRVGIVTNELEPLLLPRLDTNDLPKRADSIPNDWTTKALNPLIRGDENQEGHSAVGNL